MKSMTSRCWWIAASVAFPFMAPASTVAADAPSAPTFTKDVAPILQRSCQSCHRPEQMAPMSLVTYEEVRPFARAIKNRVMLREMPPWHIDRTVGIREYLDDQSLSDDEIATIVRWVDAGAPRGDMKDMPPPANFGSDEEWNIGTPDLIITSPPYGVPAIGPDDFPYLFSSVPITEDRYVKAIEVRPSPGGRKVVHHVNVYVIQDDAEFGAGRLTGGSRLALNAITPPPVEILDDGKPLGTHLIEYAVGNNGDSFPEGSAKLLKKGSELRWEFHYHSIGEDVNDSTQIGFVFYPKGYIPKHPIVTRTVSASNLDIPAGEPNAQHDAYFQLPRPARLISFQAHMHRRGKAMSLEAIYPDGRRETITSVPRYDWNWQITYTYKNPPLFPTGTIIHMRSIHDNSAAFRHNPDPSNWVGWGGRTVDEMAIGHCDWIFLTEEEYQQERAAKSAN